MSVENLAKIWPEWEIEKQLGRGSYGVVYKAVRRDNNVESHAAIKVISIPSDESEVDSLRSEGLDMDGTRTYFKGIVDDFVSEIQLMESLKGIQNIVSVEDYKVVERTDSIGWDIYIRMELLTPFNTFVCDKKLNEKDVIKLGIDICTALEICGQRNIIHRDIKPDNIFVNDFVYFKLGDFGIARKLENMTGGLSQKGTFNYMAPEVANSNTYDARVDTYSLGIVLYRLLNGNRLPFLDTEKQLLNPNERKNAVERRIRGEELPAPCEASPEMANLILRACAYNPDMRFTSATVMKEALIGVGNGTYVPVVADLDKTTAVRHAQADYDATTAVRRAPQAVGIPVQNNTNNKNEAVPTFGKKKSKAPKIIAIVLVLALLIGGAVVAYPYVSDLLYNDTTNNGDTENPGDNTSNGGETENPGDNTGLTDEEKIQAIVNDAEKFENSNDYQQAILILEEGLRTYPNSVELQNKLELCKQLAAGDTPDNSDSSDNNNQQPDESQHTHTFSNATCTTPKKCTVCGETSGNPLGHNWSKATCTTAKKCTVCGETSGNPLGHNWSNATCTTAKKCSICGETSGNPLGHNWSNATCTTAKKCSICGETSGNALGHNYSNGACLNCNATDPNYAQYTIIYNANGGWGETVNSTHLYNEPRRLSKNGYKRAGYIFKGWAVSPTSNAPKYSDTEIVNNLSSINGDTVTLYAVWGSSQTSTFDECKPNSIYSDKVEYHTTATDNLGYSHNNVAIFANRDTYEGYIRRDKRYVSGIFSRIKGTIFLSNAYTIDDYTSIRLVIKADGKKIYESKYFEQYSASESFDVDITGASVLEIYVEIAETDWIEYWNKGGDLMVEGLLLYR